MTTYTLIVLNKSGMYTEGTPAATPELARLAIGNLIRDPSQRLAIVRHADGETTCITDVEDTPGAWGIDRAPR